VSLYPKDDKARKALPVLKMITGYFPKALREVTRVCVVNNVRYSPDSKPTDIKWARGKSTDQFGAIYRHITEHIVDGAVYEDVPPEVAAAIGAEGFDRVYVLAEAAWRALAALELCIEEQEAKVPFVPLSRLGTPIGVGLPLRNCCDTAEGEPHLVGCSQLPGNRI
jgi:hypothetical protein